MKPPISRQQIERLLGRSLPGYALRSFARLDGGKTNHNYLLRFADRNEAMVLRMYARGRAACEKELSLWRLTRPVLPVPEIVDVQPEGYEQIGPYVIYHFAEGATFQEVKRAGTSEDMAGAAHAIGSALARVHSMGTVDDWGSDRSLDEKFDSPVLEQRLRFGDMARLRNLLARWSNGIRGLDRSRALVHGDFNNRNTIVKQAGGRWTVSAILDWEKACSGSPLWDVARFVCYEHPGRPCREPFFSNGYREAGGTLPEDWPEFARGLNALSAARSLANPEISTEFVPELVDLVAGILDAQV